MLTLLTYAKLGTSFSASPFCVKAAMLLAHSGQPWQREDLADPRPMPQQKLPVLRTAAGLVADSDGIRQWLEQQGADFDPGLSEKDKACARMLIRMAEEHLYFHIVLDRWHNDAVWPSIRDSYFSAIPRVLRGVITNKLRRQVIAGLNSQGILRFPAAERMQRLDKDLAALVCWLGDKEFLMGSQMTSADFSVAPMLAAMAATPVQTALTQRIAQDAVLSDYVTRVEHEVPLP